MTKFMPGYRLHAAARRASLMIETAPPMATPIINTLKTEYRPEHYRWQRQQTNGVPLERTGPAVEPLWKTILAGALIAFAIGIVLVLT